MTAIRHQTPSVRVTTGQCADVRAASKLAPEAAPELSRTDRGDHSPGWLPLPEGRQRDVHCKAPTVVHHDHPRRRAADARHGCNIRRRQALPALGKRGGFAQVHGWARSSASKPPRTIVAIVAGDVRGRTEHDGPRRAARGIDAPPARARREGRASVANGALAQRWTPKPRDSPNRVKPQLQASPEVRFQSLLVNLV